MDENEKKLNNTDKNDDLDFDSKLSEFLNESFKASKELDSIVGEDKSENVVASADVTLTNLETRKPLESLNSLNDKKVHKEESEALKNVSSISKESIIPSNEEDLSLDINESLNAKNKIKEAEDEFKKEVTSKIPKQSNAINGDFELDTNSQKEKFNLNIDYSKSDISRPKSSHKVSDNNSKKQNKKKKVEVNYSIFTGLIVTVVVLVVSVSLAFFGISLGLEY